MKKLKRRSNVRLVRPEYSLRHYGRDILVVGTGPSIVKWTPYFGQPYKCILPVFG